MNTFTKAIETTTKTTRYQEMNENAREMHAKFLLSITTNNKRFKIYSKKKYMRRLERLPDLYSILQIWRNRNSRDFILAI